MEVSAEQLHEQYESLETDELVDLHRNSDLTELATSVLSEILMSRGINSENLGLLEKEQAAEEIKAARGPIPVSLPKIWIGYLIVALFLVYGIAEVVLNPSSEEQISAPLVIISIIGWFYWLFCVQRLHQVMSYATNATHPISPLKAVAFHFVPFFNLYWIFKWPNEVASFVNNRAGEKRMLKGWVGIVILLGSLIGRFDYSIGLLVLFTVCLYLNKKMKAVLEFA
jgi:hypothetical protein